MQILNQTHLSPKKKTTKKWIYIFFYTKKPLYKHIASLYHSLCLNKYIHNTNVPKILYSGS